MYKIFTFNGVPKIIQTIQNDKTNNESVDYFDCTWNLLDMRQKYPNSIVRIERPKCLSKMIELSKVLGHQIPFVRCDWYSVNNQVFFSEFTFYSDAGFARFYPWKYDVILGNMIDLPG